MYVKLEGAGEIAYKATNNECIMGTIKIYTISNFRRRATTKAKNYRPVSLLSVVIKVFEKLVNNRIVDQLQKCDFFRISSLVLGLLDQLQIF